MVFPVASAVTKCFAALRVLRRARGSLALSTLAENAGMATSTAHSVLTELARLEVVVQDEDKRYALGPYLYYLGSGYARDRPLYRAVWSELVELCNETGVVGAIAYPWDDHHLILASHQAGRPGVGVAFGGRVPLEVGSWGKVHAAWSDDGKAPPKADRSDREATRSRGYASDLEEFIAGVGTVASAVTSARGYEGLASCVASIARMDELGLDEVGARLAAITARASFGLGDPSRMPLVGAE